MSQPPGVDPDAEATQVLPGAAEASLPPAATQVFDPAAGATHVLPATIPAPASAPAAVRRTAALPADRSGRPRPTTPPPSGERSAYREAAPAPHQPYRAPGPRQRPGGLPPVDSTRPAPQASPTVRPAPGPVAAPSVHAVRPAPAGPAPARPAPTSSAPARPAPAGPAPAPPRPARARGTEPTAVASLVVGIVGIVVPLIGILAIVLGGIGRDRARRRGTGGRGLANAGTALGTIQVLVTTAVVVAALAFWNAYGDDIEAGIDRANELSQTELTLPDLASGVLLGDLSLEGLGDLGGSVSDLEDLGDLGRQCQDGDVAACSELLEVAGG